MSTSRTSASAILKTHYAENMTRVILEDPRAKLYPFFGMISKKPGKFVRNAMGASYFQAVKTNDGQGISRSFSSARTVADSGNSDPIYKGFTVTAAEKYKVQDVDGLAIITSQGKENAFVDLGAEALDEAIRGLTWELASMSFKTGTNSRFRILAVDSTSITVSQSDALIRVNLGMELVAAAADGTGSLRSATARRVTAINPESGVLTLSGDPTALSWAVDDYVYRLGDFAADTVVGLRGPGAWTPVTVPSGSENFFGVDRSTDWRLYGLRHDASRSSNFKDAIIDMCGIGGGAGQVYTHGFANPIDFAKLEKLLDGQKHIEVKGEYGMGFDGLSVYTAMGRIPILPDSSVPQGNCWLLNMETWKGLYAGDGFVHIVDEDGNVILRKASTDQYEVRTRTYSMITCDNPGTNAVIYNIT